MAKETSKRIKIPALSSIKFEPVDMEKYYKDREKRLKAEEERYKKETKAEEERIKKLKCPCCKSIKKSPVCISHRDGPLIVGGRNYVNILAEYNVCQNCGTMYVDLKKKDIEPPPDRFSHF